MRLSQVLLLVLTLCWVVPAAEAQTGSVEGVVRVDGSPLENVTVDLGGHPVVPFLSTTTGANGHYEFTDVSTGDYEMWILIPLGYEAVLPENGSTTVSVNEGTTFQDFELEMVPDPGEARGVGYWKHQANVHVLGRGNAQESYADMNFTYGDRLLDFPWHPTHDIVIEDVTCDYCPASAHHVHSLYRAFGDLQADWYNVRARHQILALFLNVVSNRLQMLEVVSAGGATVSQALQQVEALYEQAQINNDPQSEEAAKDLAETINRGREVAAGAIDLSLPVILYGGAPHSGWAPRAQRATLAAVRPNPASGAVFADFNVHAAGPTEVGVYDATGRLVRTLLHDNLEQGRHRVTWDGLDESFRSVANGVYFFRIAMPKQNITTRVVVLGSE
jgi:hypothetical protein